MFIILRCSLIRVLVAQVAAVDTGTELDCTYVGVINSLHLLHCTSTKPQADMQFVPRVIVDFALLCNTAYKQS